MGSGRDCPTCEHGKCFPAYGSCAPCDICYKSQRNAIAWLVVSELESLPYPKAGIDLKLVRYWVQEVMPDVDDFDVDNALIHMKACGRITIKDNNVGLP